MAQQDNSTGNGKIAVKTTIVGGQPSRNERTLQNVPLGVEQILSMAAVDSKFEQAFLSNREATIAQSTIELTATEKGILRAADQTVLLQMIALIRQRIPDEQRREFLKKSAIAFTAMVSAGLLFLGQGCVWGVTGSRPDYPYEEPQTKPEAKEPEQKEKKKEPENKDNEQKQKLEEKQGEK